MTSVVHPWLIVVAIVFDALTSFVILERWPPAVYATGILIAHTLYGNSLVIAIMCVLIVAVGYFLTKSIGYEKPTQPRP